MILVNAFPEPYVPDPLAATSWTANLCPQRLFSQHRAWISCDAMVVESLNSIDDVRGSHRRLGPPLSELVDDNCLPIPLPQANQSFANMEETLEILESDDPLEAFHDEAPVLFIPISDSDPKMISVVQQTRDAWLEFTFAFEETAGENFGVKVPITVGDHTEFTWAEVGTAETDVVYDRIANESDTLGSLKLGPQVRAYIDNLNEWGLIDPQDKSHGLFTMQVQNEAKKLREQTLADESDASNAS